MDLAHLFVFMLDNQRFALELGSVEKVIPSVEITPLPRAPRIVIGIINIYGEVIPLVDLRKRLGFREKDLALSDRIIICRTSKRKIAILADGMEGVQECAAGDVVSAEKFMPQARYVEGAVKREDGMVLIHDIEAFLSIDEEKELSEAFRDI